MYENRISTTQKWQTRLALTAILDG